jgi:hypothetical protein
MVQSIGEVYVVIKKLFSEDLKLRIGSRRFEVEY